MHDQQKGMVVGVDVGVTGAVCLFDQRLGRIISITDMPTKESHTGRRITNILELYYLLCQCKKLGAQCIIMESLHAFPQSGAIQSFSLGHSKGLVEGLAVALSMPLYTVSPQKWKKHYGLLKICKEGSCDVLRGMDIGGNKFVTHKKHHNRAEAALIAALPASVYCPV